MNVKRTKKEQVAQLRETLKMHDAYSRVFGGEDGALVLTDLERRGFIHDLSYSPEPGRTEFNEGRRSLVMHVKYMMSSHARDAVLTALQPEKTEGD